jgi:hypothetical protein
MTVEESATRQQAVDAIIKGVVRKTALMLSLAIVAVLVFTVIGKTSQPWWFLAVSILSGGALGLLNFRWLAVSVQRVYLRPGATTASSNVAAVFISLLKLSLIFIILFIVIKWRLLHVLALVAGLSLCFLAILWEGAALMKQTIKIGDT